MSSSSVASRRRHDRWLASSVLVPVVALSVSAARAQQAPEQLPAVEVTAPGDSNRTRARPLSDGESGGSRAVPGPAPTTSSSAAPTGTAPAVRQFNGIVGASASVITSEDIARSPAQTVQEIIAQAPGVQLTSFYGGVNGVGTSVDIRGFGAFATANALVLINGRRLNDIDMAGVDLSTIPRDSIERIEITRGNSGAVLYGDNAVGGVINIVTKTGVGGPPVAMRFEAVAGSFNRQLGSISAAVNSGPWSTSFYGNAIKSDGYRAKNALYERNGVGNLNYNTPGLAAFLTLSGDDQKLGFPGGRLVDPTIGLNLLSTDRRGAGTPFDFGNKQGVNVTAGFTKTISYAVELIVDGGVRDKNQQAGFFGNVPLQAFNASHVGTRLETWSVTPRLNIKSLMFGLPSTILTGIDYYDASYHSNRSQLQSSPPLDAFDLSQQTLAAYWQQNIGVFQSTDFSYGGRIQSTGVTARDLLNPAAPGFFGQNQIAPLDSSEINHALHIGLEHRFNDSFAVFGRAASAFRTPTVDERVGASPIFDPTFTMPLPRSFVLKTQTSNDVEAGYRIRAGRFEMQSSVYDMDLTNEIHFDPVNFIDYNLDPTRRYGTETATSYRASDTVLLRGGFAFTRAIFREGRFTGNDIPLVSRTTANAGVTWNVWQNYLVVDATVRYWSRRLMDNDQPNMQPLIPANATVDFRLSGGYERFFWSLSVNNLFNALYYDYAIASAFTEGRFSAYPLPGRTFLLKAGATF